MKPLLWLDLETTGTDEKTGQILEVACIITDGEYPFEFIAEDYWVVRPTGQFLIDPFVLNMHLGNGLLADVVDEEMSSDLSTTQRSIIEWLGRHVPKGRLRLAGSGVGHFDRRWIDYHLPQLSARLDYAPFDVGQVRRFLAAVNPDLIGTAHEGKTHRALDDIRVHLAEARHYGAAIKGVTS